MNKQDRTLKGAIYFDQTHAAQMHNVATWQQREKYETSWQFHLQVSPHTSSGTTIPFNNHLYHSNLPIRHLGSLLGRLGVGGHLWKSSDKNC